MSTKDGSPLMISKGNVKVEKAFISSFTITLIKQSTILKFEMWGMASLNQTG